LPFQNPRSEIRNPQSAWLSPALAGLRGRCIRFPGAYALGGEAGCCHLLRRLPVRDSARRLNFGFNAETRTGVSVFFLNKLNELNELNKLYELSPT